MIVYNDDADLEVSDTCVRNSLLSCVEYDLSSAACKLRYGGFHVGVRAGL